MRRLFKPRKGNPSPLDDMDWSKFSAALRQHSEHKQSAAQAAIARSEPQAPLQEEELLDRISAFRAAVADSLYESCKDYQLLCDVTQADLASCDHIAAEMRGRLVGNIHYAVLGKLDEVCTLVATHISSKA
jgi:hypothetical protein